MSEPIFSNQGTKYNIRWDDYNLNCEISRLHINQNNARCLLVFTSDHQNADPHILQTRFNLESARTRSELAKELAIRYQIDTPIDWKALLEYLSVKTLQEYERGEPVIEIRSTDEIRPLEFLISPIAPLNKPTVIFGDPGAGKSLLAIVICIVMALPWYDNPLGLIPASQPKRALFLDYEADPDDLRRQFTSLVTNLKLGYAQFYYRRCSLPLVEDIESIREHMSRVKADCIIIDSASLAAGDDLNRMNVATSYFRALRQLNTTTISLSHTSKDRDSKSKTILGSVLWEAGSRSVIECRGQEDDDALNAVLFHRKSNLSKKFKPLGYRIQFNNNLPVSLEWHDPRNVSEFVARMGNNQRILELLKEGRMTGKEITQTLDISYASAGVTLKRLLNKGLIVKLDDKTWGLASFT